MGKRYHGYTLIELLVVLGIMVIAFSYVIVNTIRSDSMALKASQRIISAVAQGAKGQAILKQAPSRLIIYADQGEGSDKINIFVILELLHRIHKIRGNGLLVLMELIFLKVFILCLNSVRLLMVGRIDLGKCI